MSNVESIYFDGTYLSENPDWDRKDAPWKAVQVATILSENSILPSTLCEVGCGSGDVLVHLKKSMPSTKMKGYDISPQVVKFWKNHNVGVGVEFQLGNFHEVNMMKYDVLLMLDVFEHIRDPFSFLENSKQHAVQMAIVLILAMMVWLVKHMLEN